MLPAGVAGYVAEASNLRTLAAAAQGSGLSRTLAQPGPFTVFAPTDAAFDRLAPAPRAALMTPEHRATLLKVLNYHVLAGRFTVADLRARVAAGGGSATLASVEGDPLTLSVTGGYLTLTDADGNRSYVETGDIARANGIVHVVNGVLVPRLP